MSRIRRDRELLQAINTRFDRHDRPDVMTLVLGIDGGTESLRARVYDLAGRCVASAAEAYPTRFMPGGRAEQDPEDWWTALGSTVRQVLAQGTIRASDISALALATTCCSVVALDADTRVLGPAIIWMDVRAAAEAEAVLATGDAALSVNGAGHGPVSAEWMIPKALWIARHDPDVYERAHTICEYQDFMSMRLTGRRVGSLSNASIRWHYSTDRGGFPMQLLDSLGLSSLRAKWPDEMLPPGAPIGRLTQAAANHLGLATDVQVVQGGVDALMGVIGLGVHRTGQLALITGSSHLQYGMLEKATSVPGLWGGYSDAIYPGRYILEGGQTSTGSIINWLRRLRGGTLDFDVLNAEAADIEPGCDGLLVLDHFQGNRTPYTDAHSRGAITGLTLGHELPHLFRGIIESICLGTRAIIDRMRDAGFPASEIVIGGGAASSELWLQIHADTAGLPVVVPPASEVPSLGAAIAAAVGLGKFKSLDQGIAAMVSPGRRIEPRPREQALYDGIYRRYQSLYPALKPIRASVPLTAPPT